MTLSVIPPQQLISELTPETLSYLARSGKITEKEFNFLKQFLHCGKWRVIEGTCKTCDSPILFETNEEKVNFIAHKHYCKLKYHSEPGCVTYRFAELLNEMLTVKTSRYQTLWHFVIGFEPITLIEFQNNFSYYKKRFEAVLNNYFSKLRKHFIDINAFRVLDFRFHLDTKKVYVHFHFGAVPIDKIRRGTIMRTMHLIKKDMIDRMRIKNPFSLKFFKHAQKKSVLSYLSIRASGLYKYKDNNETKNINYTPQRIEKSLKQGKWVLLNQILTPKQYLEHFYSKNFFVVIGKLLYGSTIQPVITFICPKCGVRDPRFDINFMINYTADLTVVKPPDLSQFSTKKPEISQVATRKPCDEFEIPISYVKVSRRGIGRPDRDKIPFQKLKEWNIKNANL